MSEKKELIINPLLAEKEAEFKDLEKKYKMLLKKLETEKSKIRQLKDDMISVQRGAFSSISVKMDALKQLQEELKKILKEAAASKLFNRQEKKTLKEMAREMEGEMFGGMTGAFEKEPPSEEQEARSANFFKEFIVAPALEESQNIRKLFLKLATRFHPDKGRNDKESGELHKLMQRINEAYKAGDMAELLAIEAQYIASEPIEGVDSTTLIDILQKRIDRLVSDIELLEDQLKRTKKESANITRSDAGKIHRQMKKNSSPLDFMTRDIDQALAGLTLLRDGLKTYLETGVMPDSLARELEPEPYQELDLDEVLAIMLEMQEQEDRRRKSTKKAKKKKNTR
jgi:hypothetical protein